MSKLYLCDPNKNAECKKTACHINGGSCRMTTDILSAKILVDPEDGKKYRVCNEFTQGSFDNVYMEED